MEYILNENDWLQHKYDSNYDIDYDELFHAYQSGLITEEELYHFGIPGMKWGVRKFEQRALGISRNRNNAYFGNSFKTQKQSTFNGLSRKQNASAYNKMMQRRKMIESQRQLALQRKQSRLMSSLMRPPKQQSSSFPAVKNSKGGLITNYGRKTTGMKTNMSKQQFMNSLTRINSGNINKQTVNVGKSAVENLTKDLMNKNNSLINNSRQQMQKVNNDYMRKQQSALDNFYKTMF